MGTVEDLALDEQLSDVEDIARARSWVFERIDQHRFRVKLPARDGSLFRLLVECDNFLTRPPAFNWEDETGTHLNRLDDAPKGGSFFISPGIVCAPWNRLAYTSEFERGPHADWTLANWLSNPKTGETKTLSAMLIRIYVELNGPQFQGRLAR